MRFPAPHHKEIDHRTIKLLVGLMALSLAFLTNLFAAAPLTSISDAYHHAGWSQTTFIGFLSAIAAFLLAYNGYSRKEMILSKVASIAALGIILFPCECAGHPPLVPKVHGIAAAVMFLILVYLCVLFRQRAIAKASTQSKARGWIYAACATAMLGVILVLAYDELTGGSLTATWPRLTFFGEATALFFFGISWLTASRVLPLITDVNERFSPLRASNPD